ncbi:hypothetical protein [Amycolatopsis benzoatilytica]|nr:hypothetical protein [Amycolatopsis benzoatilytica]
MITYSPNTGFDQPPPDREIDWYLVDIERLRLDGTHLTGAHPEGS